MRNRDVPTVVRLLEHARYEVLPTPTIEDTLLGRRSHHVQLTVTASPTKGLAQTFALAERSPPRVRRHPPRRGAHGHRTRHLKDIVDRLTRPASRHLRAGAATPPGPATTPTR